MRWPSGTNYYLLYKYGKDYFLLDQLTVFKYIDVGESEHDLATATIKWVTALKTEHIGIVGQPYCRFNCSSAVFRGFSRAHSHYLWHCIRLKRGNNPWQTVIGQNQISTVTHMENSSLQMGSRFLYLGK